MTHTPDASPYVGRFAPSPTGALHFGSLVAATGSYLDARSRGGKWLLRIEDVDAPRNRPGAEIAILNTLERYGFEWDAPFVRQSERLDRYASVIESLKHGGKVFPCCCSRREIANALLAQDGSRIYPGSCRNGLPPGRTARAWRVGVAGTVCFDDAIQGRNCEDLEAAVGDFVVRRADDQFAYQLAVVVDDRDTGITHVVRGADLLDSTGRQIYLQQLLGYPQPEYAHIPVVTNSHGEKLSKQTLATAINGDTCTEALLGALRFLGQTPPSTLNQAPVGRIWEWAISNWSMTRVPRVRSAPQNGIG